jgi:hypothetical protein
MATLVNTTHETFLTKNGNILVNLYSCGAFFAPCGNFLRWVYVDELVHLIGGTPRWISTSSNLGFSEHDLEEVEGILPKIEIETIFEIPEMSEDSFIEIAYYAIPNGTCYLEENLLGQQRQYSRYDYEE